MLCSSSSAIVILCLAPFSLALVETEKTNMSSLPPPPPVPEWPPGGNFAAGTIDLGGGLLVRQIRSFAKVLTVSRPDGGATFFEPTSPLPEGFAMFGSYGQTNSRPLFGSVLVGKDAGCGRGPPAVQQPTDYALVWRSDSPAASASFWSPTCSSGYSAVGLIAMASDDKPPLHKVRCVRSDLTDFSDLDEFIWGQGGFRLYNLRPRNRESQARGLCPGTFGATTQTLCLRNNYANCSYHSPMPNLNQVKAIFQAYAPVIYVHPKEDNLPSSVSWFFSNGALLYRKGEESNPVHIDPTGSNLPQGGTKDGAFWIDLPWDDDTRNKLKNGNSQSLEVYLHAKQMLGGTATHIVMWVFYPFNGGATARAGSLDISLGKIGEHVGDWEHLTMQISNFDGELEKVFFSAHSGGYWSRAADLEFQPGTSKFVAHASRHGHAFYPKPGLVLQGIDGFGIRNDAAKGGTMLDAAAKFTVIAADYSGLEEPVVQPPWLNYMREWGPKISYDKDIEKVRKFLFGKLRKLFDKFINSLPREALGEEGPAGPKGKNNWNGEEGDR